MAQSQTSGPTVEEGKEQREGGRGCPVLNLTRRCCRWFTIDGSPDGRCHDQYFGSRLHLLLLLDVVGHHHSFRRCTVEKRLDLRMTLTLVAPASISFFLADGH